MRCEEVFCLISKKPVRRCRIKGRCLCVQSQREAIVQYDISSVGLEI